MPLVTNITTEGITPTSATLTWKLNKNDGTYYEVDYYQVILGEMNGNGSLIELERQNTTG